MGSNSLSCPPLYAIHLHEVENKERMEICIVGKMTVGIKDVAPNQHQLSDSHQAGLFHQHGVRVCCQFTCKFASTWSSSGSLAFLALFKFRLHLPHVHMWQFVHYTIHAYITDKLLYKIIIQVPSNGDIVRKIYVPALGLEPSDLNLLAITTHTGICSSLQSLCHKWWPVPRRPSWDH